MRTQDDTPDMWTYWKAKYGEVAALEDYYPNLLARNAQLQAQVNAIKAALTVIDHVMGEDE